MTHKGLEAAQQEISQARDWVKEKMAFVQSPPPLGYENKATEERLQLLKVSYTICKITKFIETIILSNISFTICKILKFIGKYHHR